MKIPIRDAHQMQILTEAASRYRIPCSHLLRLSTLGVIRAERFTPADAPAKLRLGNWTSDLQIPVNFFGDQKEIDDFARYLGLKPAACVRECVLAVLVAEQELLIKFCGQAEILPPARKMHYIYRLARINIEADIEQLRAHILRPDPSAPLSLFRDADATKN